MIDTVTKRRAYDGVVVIYAHHPDYGDDISIKCDRRLRPEDAPFIERAVRDMIEEMEMAELPLFYRHTEKPKRSIP